MLIEQQELETFAKYYAELTPGEKIIYGGSDSSASITSGISTFFCSS
jgi:hypothetical protein